MKKEIKEMEHIEAQEHFMDCSECKEWFEMMRKETCEKIEKEFYKKGFVDGLESETIQRDEYTIEKLKEQEKEIIRKLPDCTGCTDPQSEGTHQEMTKQHFGK